MSMTDNTISMVSQAAQANATAQSNQSTDKEIGVGFQNLLEGKKTDSKTDGQLSQVSDQDTEQKKDTGHSLSLLDYLFQSMALGQIPVDIQTVDTAQAGNSASDLSGLDMADFASVSLVPSTQGEVSVAQTMPSVETLVSQESALQQANPVQQQGIPQSADMLPQNTDSQTVSTAVEQPAIAVASTQDTSSLQQTGMEKQGQQESGAQSETTSQSHQNEGQVTVSTASSRPLFAQMESMPIKVGDPQPLDTTSGDFEVKLAGRVSQALEHGTDQVEIQLSPENLGNVVVKLTRNEEGILHVVLYADNERAARLLGEHSSALGMMLQNSGQGEVQIEVPQPQQEDQLWQQPDQQQGQNQGGQPREQQNRKQNSDDFLQQIRLGLFQMETQQV